MSTNRELLTLATMAVGSDDSRHTRTQITSILFLLDREASQMFGGPYFDFIPGTFGPRDPGIDEMFVSLSDLSLVVIRKLGAKSRLYRLSDNGTRAGNAYLAKMDAEKIHHLREVSSWVKSSHALAIEDAIFIKHPDMTIARTGRGS